MLRSLLEITTKFLVAKLQSSVGLNKLIESEKAFTSSGLVYVKVDDISFNKLQEHW